MWGPKNKEHGRVLVIVIWHPVELSRTGSCVCLCLCWWTSPLRTANKGGWRKEPQRWTLAWLNGQWVGKAPWCDLWPLAKVFFFFFTGKIKWKHLQKEQQGQSQVSSFRDGGWKKRKQHERRDVESMAQKSHPEHRQKTPHRKHPLLLAGYNNITDKCCSCLGLLLKMLTSCTHDVGLYRVC